MATMADQHSFRDLAHWVMHRIPGVPAHVEHPAGHQGTTRHGRAWRNSVAHHRSQNHRWNHSPARPPRVLVAWQRRIAAVFGQEL
jgi:hypothetical protein